MRKRNDDTHNRALLSKDSNQSRRERLTSAVMTTLASVTCTAALVAVHHHYRKRRQPDASLQDYVIGVRAQWQTWHLSSSSEPQPSEQPKWSKLARFRHACQQAAVTWQRAYQQPYSDNTDNNVISDLAAVNTTIMMARPMCWVSGVASMPKNLTDTDHTDGQSDNDFGVVGIDADRQIVWQTTMSERVHDIVVQPSVDGVLDTDTQYDMQYHKTNHQQCRDVVVMGRRPSEKFWVLDTATGQVKTAIQAANHRHFYGHACYSLDAQRLYVTENDTVSLDGKIGVYDATDDYQKIAEFDAFGIGPHELVMHPDGDTLVIANGGIKTERASREELNLDSMRPSLVYLNRHTGALLEQVVPAHNQMSVRHLAMHDDGRAMIGIQFQGDKHINVPLVLTHQRGDADFEPLTMPNDEWQRFHQYIASVAVDSVHDLLCVTTPIGGCAAIYDLNTQQLIDDVSLSDCAGASVLADEKKAGFIVSDGQGRLTTLEVKSALTAANTSLDTAWQVRSDSKWHKMSFDNHLQAL
ncbi:MAG: DUF1513 domain-containing protein [Psychrobacter celer]